MLRCFCYKRPFSTHVYFPFSGAQNPLVDDSNSTAEEINNDINKASNGPNIREIDNKSKELRFVEKLISLSTVEQQKSSPSAQRLWKDVWKGSCWNSALIIAFCCLEEIKIIFRLQLVMNELCAA